MNSPSTSSSCTPGARQPALLQHLAELARLPYVAQTALVKLDAYAQSHPVPSAEIVEGVSFLGWESEAVTWGVNHAQDAELKALGLNLTQIANLDAARPFTNVGQMGPVKYIGPAALASLEKGALGFWKSMRGSCNVAFGSISAPAVETYATQVTTFDERDPMYDYQIGAKSAPACLDPKANEQALRELLIGFSGWTETVKEFPQVFEYGALTAGPSVFRSWFDASLAHMDEFRAERVANGDPNAQAQFDVLSASHAKAAALTTVHATGTYSMVIRIEASECSERAVLFVDPAAGLVIMMHQPPQCRPRTTSLPKRSASLSNDPVRAAVFTSALLCVACSSAMMDPADGGEDATLESTVMDAMGMDAGPCPPGMALVGTDGGVCIDLFEGALVQKLADGEAPWPWFDPIDQVDAASIRAVPAMAIHPQGYISQVQATAACASSGKRLCTLEEWSAACRGRPDHDFIYPYGDTYDTAACNEGRASPIVRLFPNPTYSYQELNDPRCDQLDAGIARGGDFPQCKSSYGAFDMHGNLHEWIDDSPNGDPSKGSFMGGFFVDAKLNGPGCTYRTTAHAKTYHDYSTGFRCCADPSKK